MIELRTRNRIDTAITFNCEKRSLTVPQFFHTLQALMHHTSLFVGLRKTIYSAHGLKRDITLFCVTMYAGMRSSSR